jgi:hypothetical protein
LLNPSSSDASRQHDPALAANVRNQAVWAAIAAVMMLYFGFRSVFIGESFAVKLLQYTLQIGGIGMAVSALLLFIGRPIALLVDGVMAMIIGIALCLVGILMLVVEKQVDVQTLLYVVFGYLFFTSGLRSFRDFCRLGEVPEAQAHTADAAAPYNSATAKTPPTTTPAHEDSPPEEAFRTTERTPDTEPPPPEGYLSSFADDDASKRPRE